MIRKHRCWNRVSFLFLISIGLFFLNFSQTGFALGSSYTLADILQQESAADPEWNTETPKKKLIRPCRGFRQANTDKKIVAITFDDGPHKKYTAQILDVLKTYGIKGTFFVVGENANEYPGLVRKMHQEGHIVANHTYYHGRLPKLSGQEIEDELVENTKLIKKLIGFEPVLFRPPYGACSDRSERVARNLKLKPIIWSAITDDYNVDKTNPEKISAEIFSLVKPGAIIVMHDGGGNREKTVEALPILISALRNDGYEFVPLKELLNIKPYREKHYREKPGIGVQESFLSLAREN